MSSSHGVTSPSSPATPRQQEAMLLRDAQSCLPLSRVLSDGDIVVLLTPVVVPDARHPQEPGAGSDPFEPLGRALARHHSWIRHVPYTAKGGITSTHVAFIRRAGAIIFVISGPPHHGQASQVELAEIVRAIGENRPQVVITCCHISELGPLDSLPTIVQLSGYSPPELESAAELLFQEADPSSGPSSDPSSGTPSVSAATPNVQNLVIAPKFWPVELWNENHDVPAVLELWEQCFPDRLRLNRYILQSLLKRDGYAMHYVVHDHETGDVVGFCATYTTYVDSESERLIGSLAVILVRSSYRRRGVGLSLHDHAMKQLAKTRGVCRLRLGTTFPRLLYGLPLNSPAEDWFRRRGWQMDEARPGAGQEATDWFLRFEDWPARGFASANLVFRRCTPADFDAVLQIVEQESATKDYMGWYDQYAKLANTSYTEDIILGIDGSTIVATALTYINNRGSPVAEDLPWAGTISDDVGGVTCICIPDKTATTGTRRDTIMIRLLDACVRLFGEQQGMRNLFIDAMKGGEEGFLSMGFRRWARFRDVWRET